MNPELKLPYLRKRRTDREKVRLNKRLVIYLFFLVISFLFWYLQALSKEYITNINYSVAYKNLPRGKILISDKEQDIQLRVKGFGFHILKYKIFSVFSPLHLNLNEYRLDVQRNNDKFNYFLITRYATDKLASQVPDVQLIDVIPDTLYFQFTEIVDRKIPVKPVLHVEYKKQYMQRGNVRVIPDSITVSGPRVILDTLQFIATKEIKLKHVSDSVIKETDLQPVSQVIIPDKPVKVVVPSAMYTEWIKDIPVEVINLPDSLDLKTFPAYITVSCWVSVKDYEKLSPFMFRPVVDYRTIDSVNTQKLKVTLLKQPPLVYNVRFHPKNIDYIIEKW